jgi:putative acetyltransferase
MIRIRTATKHDAEAIRDIHLYAFPDGESERIAKLAVDLLLEESTPPILSLVAEADCGIVGHVAFSPVAIDGNHDFQGYILAPLAVRPGHQKQGIGSQLVAEGMRRQSETNACVLLVYGDPEFYGRFGFRADVAEPFIPPHELMYPFGWQGFMLRERGSEINPAGIRCVSSLRDPSLW